MRIVYMGTPDFARAPLEKLIENGYELAAVFTQPDKPKSRGMKVTFSPVKEIAIAHNIPVYQPDTLKDGAAVPALAELAPDLVVAVAYGKILPKQMLEIPKMGCINIHASLLPKYRGAAPIQWAVLNGDKVTGVTSMYLAEEMDTGDIIMVRETPIGEHETSGELFLRLELLGAELLADTVAALADGTAIRVKQDDEKATYTKMLSRDMSPIDWNDTAFNIGCKVRGLCPWPTATTVLRDTLYKIFAVETSQKKTSAAPGEIISAGKHGIEVACSDGTVIIKQLQAPGARRMAAADHLKGNPF